jgi:hypothetical protein
MVDGQRSLRGDLHCLHVSTTHRDTETERYFWFSSVPLCLSGSHACVLSEWTSRASRDAETPGRGDELFNYAPRLRASAIRGQYRSMACVFQIATR